MLSGSNFSDVNCFEYANLMKSVILNHFKRFYCEINSPSISVNSFVILSGLLEYY